MNWLWDNIGQAEISGGVANSFITDTFNYTTLKNHPLSLSDETAWCAALTCAALEKNGYLSTHSASAASYDTYGETSELVYGAIITLKRDGGSGRHVTFYVDTASTGHLYCIGGNQRNALRMSTYNMSDLRAIRWPMKKT